MRRRLSASMTAVALVVLIGCDLDGRAVETTTTLATLPGGAPPFIEPPPSSNTRPVTTRPATNPCRDYDGWGHVGYINDDDTGTRIFATEGAVRPGGTIDHVASECEVIGPPAGIDALVDGEWVELETEPAPVELQPVLGALPLSGVVHPIWLPRCDGEAIVSEQLRLRLDDGVTLVIESVSGFGDDIEFVVGCDGVMSAVPVGLPFSFQGYG